MNNSNNDSMVKEQAINDKLKNKYEQELVKIYINNKKMHIQNVYVVYVKVDRLY